MKTLIVLSALAAVATAAPASQTFGSNQITAAQDKLPTTFKREKKSPAQSLSDDIAPDTASIPSFFQSELDSAPETSARTLGLKKPIIVKKKHGYHLYRDSAEEQAQADSQEKCMKEVKVKLCDVSSTSGFVKVDDSERSSTIEDVGKQMPENDMEQSIKMAKEAVENLQKGFQNIEHSSGAKMSQWKHSGSGSDAEMHQDIETARQALEHIQKNFGNLESMNLQAATLRDAEALEDAHLKIVKTTNDEERMAQWKEAMDNIQKNVEIAKNLEDSFKSSSPVISEPAKTLEHLEQKASMMHESIMKSTDGKPEKVQSEMEASASEPKESKVEFHGNANNEKLLRSDDIPVTSGKVAVLKSEELSLNVESNAVEKKLNAENIKKGKSSELDSSSLSTPATLMQEKKAETEKENEMKVSEKTEKIIDTEVPHSVSKMKSNDELLNTDEHRAVKEWKKDSIGKNVEHEKSAWKETENKNMLAKSTETNKIESKPNMDHGKNADLDTTLLMKSVEHIDQNKKKLEKSADKMDFAKDAHHDMNMKSVDQAVHESQQINHVLPLNTNNVADHHLETVMKMKSAEHTNEHLKPISMAQNSNLHSEKIPFPKEAEKGNNEFHNIQMERKSDFIEQTFSRTHDNKVAHGKSVNMDSTMLPTMQMNMREAAEKSALDRNNMMQWKHEHGARGAYGAGPYGSGASGLHIGSGAAGGSGAVGVFPNANLGGCAIPLLLSCSPSVVSGSLAKSHAPSYAAPAAYRTGEGFKFHNKRDILKNNKISTTKVKRTPATRIIQKIPVDTQL